MHLCVNAPNRGDHWESKFGCCYCCVIFSTPEMELSAIVKAVQREKRPLRSAGQIGVKVGKVIKKSPHTVRRSIERWLNQGLEG